jgi:hypothetical protein
LGVLNVNYGCGRGGGAGLRRAGFLLYPKTMLHEERFDVVDEQDRVVGSAPRREVHARGLLHRAVHALVFDPAGRLLLQKRSATKDMYPNQWAASASGRLR